VDSGSGESITCTSNPCVLRGKLYFLRSRRTACDYQNNQTPSSISPSLQSDKWQNFTSRLSDVCFGINSSSVTAPHTRGLSGRLDIACGQISLIGSSGTCRCVSALFLTLRNVFDPAFYICSPLKPPAIAFYRSLLSTTTVRAAISPMRCQCSVSATTMIPTIKLKKPSTNMSRFRTKARQNPHNCKSVPKTRMPNKSFPGE
jgi:hypothetical protein